jgi:uncharacterized membrane protein YccF (DUF307 family)
LTKKWPGANFYQALGWQSTAPYGGESAATENRRTLMTLILNILWFIFGGGFIAWLMWILTGGLLFITVVGIPFAWAAFRIAGFAAFPFGKDLVDARDVGDERLIGTGLANFLWIILAGIWLAISHILAGASLCLTIIGIPFGFAHFRLALVCFAPLGKRVVYH